MTLPPRLAANVGWLFTERPWLDRFAAAREAGFGAVEFPWPEDPAATADAARSAGLRVAMLNMPAGDLAAGQRGWPNDPARIDEWRASFVDALHLAVRLGCPTINVLAGNRIGDDPEHELQCFEANLRWALPLASVRSVRLVTELLNRRENPRYLLSTLGEAEPFLGRLSVLGWRLQLDTYHLGLTDADVAGAIRRAGELIGHVQVADVPGRHEPGSGALDWPAIRAALEAVGYRGPLGLEYAPEGSTEAGLRGAVAHVMGDGGLT